MYKPPFSITAKIISLVADISAQIERYAIRLEMEDSLHLRKTNRIKTIHSSLAIEGNKLTENVALNVATNVALNSNDLAEKLGVSRKTIERDMTVLQKKGLVQRIGSNKTGYWAVVK